MWVRRAWESVQWEQALTSGPKNPQQILSIQGRDAVRRYPIDEVQTVYRSQGVPIHNKHVELIISQMPRKVRIDDPGDTDPLPAEVIDRRNHEEPNQGILPVGGEDLCRVSSDLTGTCDHDIHGVKVFRCWAAIIGRRARLATGRRRPSLGSRSASGRAGSSCVVRCERAGPSIPSQGDRG